MCQAEKCAKRGIKALIIITGGFTEKQRKHLLRLRERHDIRILGPNTILGALNTTNGLNTTFEEDSIYSQKDAEGFIRLNALRLKVRAQQSSSGK